MKPDEINQLLDLTKAQTGSDYKTAQRIKASRKALSDWRHGRQTMPAADVALVADVAGLDAVAWCARSINDHHAGTEKGALLSHALKKALQATGGGLDGSGEAVNHFTRCIKRQEPKVQRAKRQVGMWYPAPRRDRLPYRFATCYA